MPYVLDNIENTPLTFHTSVTFSEDVMLEIRQLPIKVSENPTLSCFHYLLTWLLLIVVKLIKINSYPY